MTIRNEGYTKTSETGDASTSRPLTEARERSLDMQDDTESAPAVVKNDECPKCKAPAWLASGGRMTATCGSLWKPEAGFEFTSPSCWMLEHRQDRIEELEHLVAELRGTGCVAA